MNRELISLDKFASIPLIEYFVCHIIHLFPILSHFPLGLKYVVVETDEILSYETLTGCNHATIEISSTNQHEKLI
jgi:hypothetical protein